MKLRQDTIKMIANSEFVGFTIKRLDKRYEIYSTVIADTEATDWEIADAAKKRGEVRACIDLFIQEDVDDPRATAADILEAITGESISKLQKLTIGGVIAQDILEKTGSTIKSTSKVVKKSTNGFATWLAKVTQ